MPDSQMLLKALPWQVEASVGLPARLKEGGWFRPHSQRPKITTTVIHLLPSQPQVYFFFPTDRSDE